MKTGIKLGDKIRCKVTGLEGIATAKVEYLNGCVQYALTPRVEAGKNSYPDSVYLDYKQLEVIESASVVTDTEDTGGPQMCCPKN